MTKRIWILAVLVVMAFVMHASAETVEMRGEVVDATFQIAPFTWTAQNFAGLYYDVDRNLMSDALTTTAAAPDTIDCGDLVYTAYRVESGYANPDIGGYFAVGWFGKKCMAINGKPYVLSPIICEMDPGDKITLATGEGWDIGNEYRLIVRQIDPESDLVWIALEKDDVEVETSVIQPRSRGDRFDNDMLINGSPGAYTVKMADVSTTSTFVYQKDIGVEGDVPIFSVYVDAIFRGTDTNIVQLKYAILIDDDPVRVVNGGVGMLDVETVTSESVQLSSDQSIPLLMDSDVNIAEGLWLHVADDMDHDGVHNYRYYPYLLYECASSGSTPPPPPPPPLPPVICEVSIRGEVVEPTGEEIRGIVWNASNFAALWYDFDSGASTETLAIESLNGRVIEDDMLTYTTHPVYQQYAINKAYDDVMIDGATGYNATGWIAEKYVAADGRADTLSRLLVELKGDDRKIIAVGEPWDLGEGFTLTADSIDLDGSKVWLSFARDGVEIARDVIDTHPASGSSNQNRTFVAYIEDSDGEGEIAVFHCYVEYVFRGTDSNLVQVTHVFLIDNRATKISTGDIYGAMEVINAGSDEIVLANRVMPTILYPSSRQRVMGNISFVVADNETLRFAPVLKLTEPGTYEVRGAVARPDVDPRPNQSAEIVWNASNFAALWYDFDSGTSTETLAIESLNGRVIEDDMLTYTTHPVYQQYAINKAYSDVTINGATGYNVTGWIAEKYVAAGGRADTLYRPLVEFKDNDFETIAVGEPWDLGAGFTLTAQQIDLDGNKALLSFARDGVEIASDVLDASTAPGSLNQNRTFIAYIEDPDGEGEIAVFHCYVEYVFRGTDSNLVQVTHVFLIDNRATKISTGDIYGAMEVIRADSDEIVLANRVMPTILEPGSRQRVMGNMYLRTADDNTAIRFYPAAEYTICGEEPPGYPDPEA